MHRIAKQSLYFSFTINCVFFSFVPDAVFAKHTPIPSVIVDKYLSDCQYIKAHLDAIDLFFAKSIAFFTCFLVFSVCIFILLLFRQKRIIKGDNYLITVEYGNIFNIKKCKKVISFDECFSTNLGDRPSDIKTNSLCGQYLKQNPDLDINHLLMKYEITQSRKKSDFKKQTCYEPGTLVPCGDYLLMSFAKLDADGLAFFSSRKEYLDCLATLWKEIDKYYGQHDVCIPIFGSGLTRIGSSSSDSPSKQVLLNWIIWSYRLSPFKIKKPYKLRIICKKSNDFSLNRIDVG